MENMEENEPANSSHFPVEVKNYLLETSKWGNFLAIVGYVGIGLIILMALVVLIGFSFLNPVIGNDLDMGGIGLIYIVIAVVYYFPINYLHRFSKQIKLGITGNDEHSLTSGFENLKSLFKFMGIFTIITLSIYALFLFILLPVSMLFMK
ncbi:DUF5362 family protein [Cyclobacterium sp.]|uniref:DUF5362 family protein n=1 Tax=Cyclobacterium sp. TaxID=1966343 RepID=UPI0019CD1CAC|nr:DUF5362 family protein [Cyclobacterium sp.]MBD3629293.1 hypothetical protein [Cyclobacterium sp.]